jgi:hypothetical protein
LVNERIERNPGCMMSEVPILAFCLSPEHVPSRRVADMPCPLIYAIAAEIHLHSARRFP